MFHGTALAAVRAAASLKKLRTSLGMAIKDVARKSGLDVATLSRLENGRIFNPRLDTLSRYALSLGYEMKIEYIPVASEYLD